MKNIFIVLGLFLSACSQNVTKIEPLSPHQRSQVMTSLIFGRSLDSVLGSALDSAPKRPEGLTDSDESECQQFIASLPSDYIHDYLNVPENWDDPTGAMIKIFYYGRLNPNKPTVLFHNGGPASDSHGSSEYLELNRHYNDFSFIFMDQRGTGCSSAFPLDQNVHGIDRLVQYSSRAIVKDSEALRLKLLGPATKWRVFGQSFGGRIVQRYLQMAPEGLLSAHAHGYSVMSDDYQWTAFRLLSQKRVLQDYLKTYPGDDQKILSMRKQIPDDQCFESEDSSVCGARVLDSLVLALGFKSSWPSLHQWVSSALDANGKLIPAQLNKIIQAYVFGVYAHNYAAGTVISFVDFFEDQHDLQFCDRPMAILRQMGEHPEDWALNECRLMADVHNKIWDPLILEFFKTRKGFADPIKLADLKTNLTQHSDLNFFLYSGQADVFVPVETFAEEAKYLLPLVHYTNFPNSGHEGFASEDQVWKELAN
jgi:pimeloyl-ACP methyl ester carboxylesterase